MAYTPHAPKAINHETDATYDYWAFAAPGASTASSVWQVMRINTITQVVTWADGNASYDNVGTGLAALTYS